MLCLIIAVVRSPPLAFMGNRSIIVGIVMGNRDAPACRARFTTHSPR
jgi:hypothetical protein